MENFWIAVIGFLSGIIGGMGMGGGTLFVPLMSFTEVSQHAAQGINLLSFLPMSVVALLIHRKNGLIKTKSSGWIIFPALIFAVIGAMISDKSSEKTLRIIFGIFLTLFALWQFYSAFKNKN